LVDSWLAGLKGELGLPAFASTYAYLQRDGQAELTWVTGYILKWFTHMQSAIPVLFVLNIEQLR